MSDCEILQGVSRPEMFFLLALAFVFALKTTVLGYRKPMLHSGMMFHLTLTGSVESIKHKMASATDRSRCEGCVCVRYV